MAVSVRTRFEIFKRDQFTCAYCGQSSPAVVLEVDHIVPVAAGGIDDPINLKTSCWECNRGKSDRGLNEIVTGEDPHDRAVMMLERERQLHEYNAVLAMVRQRLEEDAQELIRYWKDEEDPFFPRRERAWLIKTLETFPLETIRKYMDASHLAGNDRDLRYVKGCVRTARNGGEITRG